MNYPYHLTPFFLLIILKFLLSTLVLSLDKYYILKRRSPFPSLHCHYLPPTSMVFVLMDTLLIISPLKTRVINEILRYNLASVDDFRGLGGL